MWSLIGADNDSELQIHLNHIRAHRPHKMHISHASHHDIASVYITIGTVQRYWKDHQFLYSSAKTENQQCQTTSWQNRPYWEISKRNAIVFGGKILGSPKPFIFPSVLLCSRITWKFVTRGFSVCSDPLKQEINCVSSLSSDDLMCRRGK